MLLQKQLLQEEVKPKLNESNKNTSIFKLPYKTIKTLKMLANSGLTDTNFAVRRHFNV